MDKQITVTVNGRKMIAERGSILSEIINMEKPCGGHGRCGKCKVLVNGEEQLACRYTVETDVEVETLGSGEIASESGLTESGRLTKRLCYALDIGTTTLALALVSLDEKKAVRVLSFCWVTMAKRKCRLFSKCIG